MKRALYSIFMLAVLVGFVSCDKEEDNAIMTAWGKENVFFMDSLETVYQKQQNHSIAIAEDDTLYKLIPQYDVRFPLYYKKLAVKDGYVGVGECPKFNDYATVYYKGRLIDGTLFDSNFKGEYPDPELDISSTFLVSGLQASSSGIIYGWTEILQIMRPALLSEGKKGDFFRVYIPYQQAYGVSGLGTIPGYSALIFDINLVSFTSY